MDGYQFVAALVGSTAWPTSAIVIAFLVRRPVVALMGRAKSAEGFGAKLTFAEQVEEVQEVVDSVPLIEADALPVGDQTQPPPIANSKREDDELKGLRDALALNSAQGSIVATWQELERTIIRAAKGLSVKPVKNASAALATLFEENVISPETAEAIQRLRRLRNDVVHSIEPMHLTLQDAASYRKTAKQIADGIDAYWAVLGRSIHPE